MVLPSRIAQPCRCEAAPLEIGTASEGIGNLLTGGSVRRHAADNGHLGIFHRPALTTRRRRRPLRSFVSRRCPAADDRWSAISALLGRLKHAVGERRAHAQSLPVVADDEPHLHARGVDAPKLPGRRFRGHSQYRARRPVPAGDGSRREQVAGSPSRARSTRRTGGIACAGSSARRAAAGPPRRRRRRSNVDASVIRQDHDVVELAGVARRLDDQRREHIRCHSSRSY